MEQVYAEELVATYHIDVNLSIAIESAEGSLIVQLHGDVWALIYVGYIWSLELNYALLQII